MDKIIECCKFSSNKIVISRLSHLLCIHALESPIPKIIDQNKHIRDTCIKYEKQMTLTNIFLSCFKNAEQYFGISF